MKNEGCRKTINRWGVSAIVLFLMLLSSFFIIETLRIQKVQKITNTAYVKMSTLEEYIARVNNDSDSTNDIPLNGYYHLDEKIEINGEIIDGFNVYLENGQVISGILRFDDHSVVITNQDVTEITTSNLVLSLVGSEEIDHNYQQEYIDQMATAIDLTDGDISNKVEASGSVDINKLGRYLLTYSITNSSNKTITKTRIVNVVDKVKPVITINGKEQVVHTSNNVYTDLGAIAIDNHDGELTSKIIVTNNVKSNTVGTYQVTYTVVDVSGNASDILTRTVIVYNASTPLITIKGTSLVEHPVGTIYTDLGATSYDINDGKLSNVISKGTVDYNKVGVYKITYTSVNSQNIIGTKTRIVNVVDKIKPVITLVGGDELVYEVHSDYIEQGATSSDNYDGNITNRIVITSDINTHVVGTYLVNYNVVDSNNNIADTVTRTIHIVDTTIPAITLTGDTNVTHEAKTTYIDLGAIASDNYDTNLTPSILVTSNVDENTIGTYEVTYDVVDANGNIATTITRTVNVVDTTKPVITLTGDTTVTHEAKTTYTDLGATASDTYDGNITSSIVVTNEVDEDVVGTYEVTYDVIDANGNIATTITRTVNVADTTKPVITLTGNTSVTHEVKTTYTDLGATALDNYDNDITSSIVVTNEVDEDVIGTYEVTYDVIDANGNVATTITRTVNVVDTTKPVITIIGNSTITHEAKTTYADLGATASDNYDGTITSSILVTNEVNEDVVGTYEVTYDVIDANGNVATTVTRTVNVVDTTKPVITISGDTTITIEVGSTYTDLGATASDNYDGTITSSIVATSTVNTSVLGSYKVTYNVTDANSNKATSVIRTVNVVDTTIPLLTLSGDETVTHEAKTTYTDLGATASDNYYGNITSSVQKTGTVNTNLIGLYTITYNVTDASGNIAESISRTVNVVDTTKPVITLTGDSTISHIRGTTYTDLGATASDTYDGSLTSSIEVANNVDANTVGTYTVTYNVTDANGNVATTVTRTVNVIIQVIYNFGYTGSSQSFTAAYTGKYILEVWGAQGGNDIYYPTTHFGGTGGYTKGEISLTANTNLYIYVGGQGSGCLESNWNSSGGGGATDIRLVSGLWNNNSGLYSRIIVAGGGGGRHGKNYEKMIILGNYGGGLTSPTFTSNGYTITGANQTSGGTSTYTDLASVRPGAFGYAIPNGYTNLCSVGGYNGGGAGTDSWANGGAGGGWYGGCTSWPASSGGSSYVLTSTSVKPTGYTPTSDYYMTNTQVLNGSETMPAPGGATQTGQTGNGYARITYIGN